MAKLIKETTGKFGNELKFFQTKNLGPDRMVVIDNTAQMHRAYKIGELADLTNSGENNIKVESFDQVIEAWATGKVWF